MPREEILLLPTLMVGSEFATRAKSKLDNLSLSSLMVVTSLSSVVKMVSLTPFMLTAHIWVLISVLVVKLSGIAALNVPSTAGLSMETPVSVLTQNIWMTRSALTMPTTILRR